MSAAAVAKPPPPSGAAPSTTAIGDGGGGAAAPSVKEMLDVLLYEDAQSARKRRAILELQQLVAARPDFAEQFLDEDGLSAVLAQVKASSGNVQGALLQVLRALLRYVNALDQVAESPELVDRIYSLLVPPPDGAPVPLGVARPVLEILIVVCGTVEAGHKLINAAAKKRVGAGALPYAPLVPLLGSADLTAVHNTLLLMNVLLKKKKAASELKAKKLVFRWRECGVLSLLTPLTAVEDAEIQKQLTILQRASAVTIPRSWEEAHKYRAQFEEARRRCDVLAEQLYAFQQQQAKMRLLKAELARAAETVQALSVLLPSAAGGAAAAAAGAGPAAAIYHPTRRFRDGGGLPVGALVSNALEPIDVTPAAQAIAAARKAVFERFVAAPDFRAECQRIAGPAIIAQLRASGAIGGSGGGGGRRGGGHRDPSGGFDDLPPPPDDDEDLLPPPDDDEDLLPPPEDDEDDVLPPPEDDDDAPAAAGTAPPTASARAGGAGSGQQAAAPASPNGATTAVAAAPALGEQLASMGEAGGSTAAAATTTAAAAAASPTRVGGPPPPPPPPRAGGPPPPPPRVGGKAAAGGSGGAATAAAPAHQWFRGPAPSKKMKPLHWEKVEVEPPAAAAAGGRPLTVWHRIDNGTAGDVGFDYGEFEALFSQKEVDPAVAEQRRAAAAAAAAAKAKRLPLLEESVDRNLSIVLHKLPSIHNVQRALLELDDQTLTREALAAMLAQAPTDEVKRAFLSKAGKKPEEEYEPQEKFMAMMITMPEFKRRVQCWLFTIEWPDAFAAALKPMRRLQEAMDCVLGSRFLPYFLGVLLGFGNFMNYGDARKGNAAGVQLSLFDTLELTKDNRGKQSLFTYLIATARARNPPALDGLCEELRPLTAPALMQVRWEDVDKSAAEAERAVQQFTAQSAAVKKKLVEIGTADEDPFVPLAVEFGARCAAELGEIKSAHETLKSSLAALRAFFGPSAAGKKPEDIFRELAPFVERVRKAAAEESKEKRRTANKGQRIVGGELSDVVGKLQEEIVRI